MLIPGHVTDMRGYEGVLSLPLKISLGKERTPSSYSVLRRCTDSNGRGNGDPRVLTLSVPVGAADGSGTAVVGIAAAEGMVSIGKVDTTELAVSLGFEFASGAGLARVSKSRMVPMLSIIRD